TVNTYPRDYFFPPVLAGAAAQHRRERGFSEGLRPSKPPCCGHLLTADQMHGTFSGRLFRMNIGERSHDSSEESSLLILDFLVLTLRTGGPTLAPFPCPKATGIA